MAFQQVQTFPFLDNQLHSGARHSVGNTSAGEDDIQAKKKKKKNKEKGGEL